jgi:hypothetical protein
MLSKLRPSVLIALVLICCGCQERQSDGESASQGLNGQHKGNPAEPTVIVYYFHRTARCFSCLTIETNAAQVIKDNFPEQVANGRLMWIPFNIDDPGGEEFKREFDIATGTLVVARMVNGSHVRYKKLEEVWQLLGNSEGFSEYVKDEISKFMNDK